jgi:protoheme IX farnesyltransferase
MSLVIFTGLCGLLAAPGTIHPVIAFTAILCIAVGAGGAAALNQWWEADIDAGMKRTAGRPLPAGRMDRTSARDFGFALAGGSVMVMGLGVGVLAAAILAFSIFYYAWIYTVWLKPRTPQNIVIGGGAGAFPPMIGWVAVTGDITLMPVLLFAIIFMWTPPHFWALSLLQQKDYAAANVPMLPLTHGEKETRRRIFLYSVALVPLALAPVWSGLGHWLYGAAAGIGGAIFLVLAFRVWRSTAAGEGDKTAKALFGFSILYLAALFAALIAERIAGLA